MSKLNRALLRMVALGMLAAPGCAYDAGANGASSELEGGLVADPRLGSGRTNASALILSDSSIMIVGGTETAASRAALLRVGASAYAHTGAFRADRHAGAAVVKLTDGRVLLVGGASSRATETYSQTTNAWSNAGTTVARFDAPMLAALAGGGAVAMENTHLEIYDAPSAHWSTLAAPAAPASSGRIFGQLVGLPNGKALLTALDLSYGAVSAGHLSYISTGRAWTLDAATRAWTEVGGPIGRLDGVATLLRDGRAVFTGGVQYGPRTTNLFTPVDPVTAIEAFDPATSTFSVIAMLSTARTLHGAAQAASGELVVAGGTFGGHHLASVESLDVTTGAVNPGPALSRARSTPAVVARNDGAVFFIGGEVTAAVTSCGTITMYGISCTTTPAVGSTLVEHVNAPAR